MSSVGREPAASESGQRELSNRHGDVVDLNSVELCSFVEIRIKKFEIGVLNFSWTSSSLCCGRGLHELWKASLYSWIYR